VSQEELTATGNSICTTDAAPFSRQRGGVSVLPPSAGLRCAPRLSSLLKDATGYVQIRYHGFVEALQALASGNNLLHLIPSTRLELPFLRR
jgi:hypothetical protein